MENKRSLRRQGHVVMELPYHLFKYIHTGKIIIQYTFAALD